jgi:Putative SAM-dependent methyltransferase
MWRLLLWLLWNLLIIVVMVMEDINLHHRYYWGNLVVVGVVDGLMVVPSISRTSPSYRPLPSSSSLSIVPATTSQCRMDDRNQRLLPSRQSFHHHCICRKISTMRTSCTWEMQLLKSRTNDIEADVGAESTSKTSIESSVNIQKCSICMLLPDERSNHHQEDEDGDDDVEVNSRRTEIKLPQRHPESNINNSWKDAALDIAKKLDIPCLTQDELMVDVIDCSVDSFDDANGENLPTVSGTVVSSTSPSSSSSPRHGTYSHILRIVPYEYDDQHQQMEVTTYALAIESLTEQQQSPSKSKKKLRRQRRMKLSSNPFYIDLYPHDNSKTRRRTTMNSNIGDNAHSRGQQQQQQRDLLVQAVKPPPPSTTTRKSNNTETGPLFVIHDWTAGLGQDSTILALASGPQTLVWMFERDPVVGALLQDAIRRLHLLTSTPTAGTGSNNLAVAVDLSKRLRLTIGDGKDSMTFITDSENNQKRPYDSDYDDNSHNPSSSMSSSRQVQQHCKKPDVVYLDPMFPPRQKSAAVKKGMKLLQELLETQNEEDLNQKKSDAADGSSNNDSSSQRLDDEIELLKAALDCARLRVVVKRPIKAPPLGSRNGNDSSSSSNNNNKKTAGGDDGDGDGDVVQQPLLLPKPSYNLKGSVNRFDVYVIPPSKLG